MYEPSHYRYTGPSVDIAHASAGEISDIVGELTTHRVELGIRSEELLGARRELARVQERCRDLYDFAPLGYLTISDKGVITEANLTFCSMTGQTRGDLTGHPLSRLIIESDRDSYYSFIHTLRTERRQGRVQLRMTRADGKVFWCCMRVAPAPQESDGTVCFRAAVNDISQQKKAEQRLLEIERRFGAVLDAAEDFIHIVDSDAVVLETNGRALARSGYHHEEFVGRRLEASLTEASRGAFRDGFERLLAGEDYRQNAQMLCKDGSVIAIECRGAAVRREDGKVDFCVVMQREARAPTEESRVTEGAAAEPDRGNEEWRRLADIIRRDLANPMLSIQGFSRELRVSFGQIERLLNGQAIDRRVKERLLRILRQDINPSLEFIGTSAGEMKGLLDGLNALAAAETAVLKIELVDMNRLISRLVGGIRYQIESCGAEIALGALPACMGDVERVGQVFVNLLSNAVKYLDGDRRGRIRVSGEVRDGQSVYCVEDNGIGMTPQQMDKAFEAFYSSQVKPGDGGAGLGLSVARRILSRLGGTIRVESERGQGSRFFVVLPAS